MNICFYTGKEVSPLIGGTERITASVANGLTKFFGVKCFSIYSVPLPDVIEKNKFEGKFLLRDLRYSRQELVGFMKQNNIQVLINQGAFDLCPFFRAVVDEVGAKLVTVHHFDPGYEEHFLTFHSLLVQLRKKKNPLKIIKKIFEILYFPIKKKQYVKQVPITYKQAYEYSDRLVLLSKEFKQDFLAYGSIKSGGDKIKVIPNTLSFDSFYNIDDYSKKEKVVLIVSRLDEVQKRISLALRIWKQLNVAGNYRDWKLLIVGHGDYEKEYKFYVKKHGMHNVYFEGTQKPQKYYERASIFMLTSSHEGWGLTLTEAQQFGCVPLAFDTYKSLRDIIEDGKNGFILPDMDLKGYAEKMQCLMDSYELRRKMAAHAIEDSKRFLPEKVCEKWYNLLEDLHTDVDI